MKIILGKKCGAAAGRIRRPAVPRCFQWVERPDSAQAGKSERAPGDWLCRQRASSRSEGLRESHLKERVQARCLPCNSRKPEGPEHNSTATDHGKNRHWNQRRTRPAISIAHRGVRAPIDLRPAGARQEQVNYRGLPPSPRLRRTRKPLLQLEASIALARPACHCNNSEKKILP